MDLLRAEKAGMNVQIAMASLPTPDERMEQLEEEYQVSDRFKPMTTKMRLEYTSI